MDGRIETGFYLSLILYAIALPVSMAATNFAVGLVLLFFLIHLFRAGGKGFLPASIFAMIVFFFGRRRRIGSGPADSQFRI